MAREVPFSSVREVVERGSVARPHRKASGRVVETTSARILKRADGPVRYQRLEKPFKALQYPAECEKRSSKVG